MRKTITALLALCLSFSGCIATSKAKEKNNSPKQSAHMTHQVQTEQQVAAVVRQLTVSMLNKDLTVMDTLLSPTFTLTHITGYEQTKTEWLEEVRTERMRYYSAKEENLSVLFNKGKAEVTVRQHVDARIWGSRNTWRLQQVMTLEQHQGRWVILHSVATLF